MSYELGFWKYKKGIYMEPQTAYEQLCEGNPVTGIETLPVKKFLKKFPLNLLPGNERVYMILNQKRKVLFRLLYRINSSVLTVMKWTRKI